MPLAFLAIQNLRCFQSFQIAFDPSLNIIVGPNGTGKTTILEAIDILSRGFSFRTRSKQTLTRIGEDGFQIAGQIQKPSSQSETLKIEKYLNAPSKLLVNGSVQSSRFEAIKHLPTRIFHSESHQVIYGGSVFRRKYIDWGVFHMKQSFADDWQRYQKSLYQRNALLKQKASKKEIESWNPTLAKYGERITKARSEYLADLSTALESSGFFRESPDTVQLEHLPGWDSARSLESVLAESFEHDRFKQRTTAGPHRADIAIRWNQYNARHIASRGQQKHIALALLFTQIELFVQSTGKECLIVIDDLTSELDEESIAVVLKELKRLRQQTIITSLDEDIDTSGWERSKWFHMKHINGEAYEAQSVHTSQDSAIFQ